MFQFAVESLIMMLKLCYRTDKLMLPAEFHLMSLVYALQCTLLGMDITVYSVPCITPRYSLLGDHHGRMEQRPVHAYSIA